MTATVFVDSNIWVYYYAKNPEDKFDHARDLIDLTFSALMISTQILGELYNVLVRKQMATETDAGQISF